jgi:coenzyme F420 hydrogenase subunit beta
MSIIGLNESVIQNGFCIGCGICASVNDDSKIIFDKHGKYQAQLISTSENKNLSDVCPFSSNENEDQIVSRLVHFKNSKKHKYIGSYQEIYAGHITNTENRINSTSGGIATWVTEQLFDKGLIDGVIHVQESKDPDLFFEYVISKNIDEIKAGKKSRYYPVEMSKVLSEIKNDNKSYAIVGVPCFIKGLRLLQKNTTGFSNLKYFLGIICGQLKSKEFSNLFALQHNIDFDKLSGIDFRHKIENRKASEYGMLLKHNDGQKVKEIETAPARTLFGADWGMGMFKYEACDFCDDVFNETADIVFGDAWIKPYSDDWKGTNLVIVRNFIFSDILNEGKNENEIILAKLSEENTLMTQEPSIRHRIETIGYRLFLANKKKNWIPTKRHVLSDDFDKKTKRIQKYRMKIAKRSHSVMRFAKIIKNKGIFFLIMHVYVKLYYVKRYGLKALIPRVIIKLFSK